MFAIPELLSKRNRAITDELCQEVAGPFKSFQDGLTASFTSPVGLSFFPYGTSLQLLGDQVRVVIKQKLLDAGYEVEVTSQYPPARHGHSYEHYDSRNRRSEPAHACAKITIIKCDFHGKQKQCSEHFTTATDFFHAILVAAEKWFAQTLRDRCAAITVQEFNNGAIILPFQLLIIGSVDSAQRPPPNQFAFRLRLFEHSFKWVNATTAYSCKFSSDGSAIELRIKSKPSEIELANDTSNLVLFSACTMLQTACADPSKGPDWSTLPRDVLNRIMQFMVNTKQRAWFQVAGGSGATILVNGKYAFHSVLPTTSHHYRHLVYCKPPENDVDPPLYLVRICDETLTHFWWAIAHNIDLVNKSDALVWRTGNYESSPAFHGGGGWQRSNGVAVDTIRISLGGWE